MNLEVNCDPLSPVSYYLKVVPLTYRQQKRDLH